MADSMSQNQLKPWNVVVLARWNTAIFSPMYIASELFLAKAAEVVVEIPINAIAPVRVKYNDLIVLVDETRLVVELAKNEFGLLAMACEVARRAIEALPKTPFT